MDVSIITSLYRSEKYLSKWITELRKVAQAVHDVGCAMESVIVANDATDKERRLLDELAANPGALSVNVLHVPRESIYASWNRGVRTASSPVIGFWNVDDVRLPEAIVEGQRRISRGGCKLVYFGFTIHDTLNWMGFISVSRVKHYPAEPFDRDKFTWMMLTGPFFMFHRDLYEINGPFDERFKICGDRDWCVRAAFEHEFCHSNLLGGHFYEHGTNLSSQWKRLKIENNVVYLKYGRYEHLLHTPPDEMREVWARWADEYPLPDEVTDQLFGEGAHERWQAWQQEVIAYRRKEMLAHGWRALPRLIVDVSGLRPVLYKLGLVKSDQVTTYLS